MVQSIYLGFYQGLFPSLKIDNGFPSWSVFLHEPNNVDPNRKDPSNVVFKV
jgi:hypothetical protein